MTEIVQGKGYSAYIKSKTEILLPKEEIVLEIRDAIQAGRVPPTRATRRQHIDSLKKRHDPNRWKPN